MPRSVNSRVVILVILALVYGFGAFWAVGRFFAPLLESLSVWIRFALWLVTMIPFLWLIGGAYDEYRKNKESNRVGSIMTRLRGSEAHRK